MWCSSSAEGQLILMPPTGGETSSRNSRQFIQLGIALHQGDPNRLYGTKRINISLMAFNWLGCYCLSVMANGGHARPNSW